MRSGQSCYERSSSLSQAVMAPRRAGPLCGRCPVCLPLCVGCAVRSTGVLREDSGWRNGLGGRGVVKRCSNGSLFFGREKLQSRKIDL